ncbi:MAG: CAP domain-containing protein [Caldilineaceae bacterium]|nr:CAP domain-containing protein [Caldilineaceae bacterium]
MKNRFASSQHRFLRQAAAATVVVVFTTFYYHPSLWAEAAYTGCGGEIVAATNPTYEASVVELVNEVRAAQNLPPMKLSAGLTNSARYHAADMNQDDYFSHQTQDRRNGVLVTVCDWSARVLVYYDNHRGLAENIAAGYLSPEEVMEGWLNSSSHRDNLLGSYREIGVGFINNYWVQDFGNQSDSFPVIINREAQQTDSPQVNLYIYGDWQQMRLRNDGSNWSEWQPFQRERSWTLQNTTGERRVEVELQDPNTTLTASDTIWLNASSDNPPTPLPTIEAKARIYLPTIQQ